MVVGELRSQFLFTNGETLRLESNEKTEAIPLVACTDAQSSGYPLQYPYAKPHLRVQPVWATLAHSRHTTSTPPCLDSHASQALLTAKASYSNESVPIQTEQRKRSCD